MVGRRATTARHKVSHHHHTTTQPATDQPDGVGGSARRHAALQLSALQNLGQVEVFSKGGGDAMGQSSMQMQLQLAWAQHALILQPCLRP